MPSYSGTIIVYNAFALYAATQANLATDTFKMILLNSGYTPNQDTHDELADIVANEIAGSGYARQTLASVSWARTTTVAKFTCSPVTYTASGGSIVARRWAIFDDTTTSPTDLLVCSGLINSADADVTVPDGQTLTITPGASGLFTITRS